MSHGLAALAQEVLAEDPFSGTVIVYRSKRADRVKILVWDSSGLVPDLEAAAAGVVSLAADHGQHRCRTCSPVEFAALFDGIDWTRVQSIKGILKPTVEHKIRT